MTRDLLKLRDYQTDCIRDLHTRWDAGAWRVPSVLATGLGKTVIFCHLAEDFLKNNPGKRVLFLVHTDELANQAAGKMKSVAPHRSVGIVKAEVNNPSASVVVGSVQTLRNESRRRQIRNVGLIVVDECHHAVATTYRTILDHFGAFEYQKQAGFDSYMKTTPKVLVAGFTATLARGDKKKLSEVWEDCTFKRGISFGIRRGYLLDVRGKRVEVPEFDLSNVRKSGGDYAEGALAEELERSFAPEIVAAAYREHASDRKGIVFVPTVDSAYHFADAFNNEGIPSAVVHGKLARDERRLLLKKLAAGDIQCVINCAVLTEGFDDPSISCIVIARPTRSAPLYQQMVGRGLRPDLSLSSDLRGDCLILDVTGASRTHDLRSLVDLSEKEIRPEIADDEDLSLVDMEDAESAQEEEEGVVQEELYVGPTEHVDFDPLGRTTIGAWLQTNGGYYFLPCGVDAYVIIVPSEEPGMWDVAWLTSSATKFAHRSCTNLPPHFTTSRSCSYGHNHQGSAGGLTEHTGLSLEMATSWAEEVLEELGADGASVLGKRKARWRKDQPSVAQVYKAMSLGIEVKADAEGKYDMNKGQLNDAISTVIGGNRIDPVVSFMLKSREG
jgi:superfamily II DNA or RNA helicase